MAIEYKCEECIPANFIYIGTNPRQIYNVLLKNEIAVISLDGIFDQKRMEVPLLNRKIRLSYSIVKIAEKTKSPILPVFIIREKNNKNRIIIHEELTFNNDDMVPKYEHFLINYSKLMEKYIKQYPSHYAWFICKHREDPPPVGNIITD